jgi:lysophospholipase L1-like esterase
MKVYRLTLALASGLAALVGTTHATDIARYNMTSNTSSGDAEEYSTATDITVAPGFNSSGRSSSALNFFTRAASSGLEGPLYRKHWAERFSSVFPSSGTEVPLQEAMPTTDRFFYIASNAEHKARIMCVGDSITEGGSTYSVYRPELNSQLLAAGYRFEFVGSKTNTRQGVTLKHEGYAGKNATQVAGFLSSTFPDNIADIVLIHAGHNYFADVQGKASIVNEVETATRSMIATARTHNPDVIILLAQVITSSKLPKYSYIPALNTRLAEVAGELNTEEQPVIIVNQAEGWDPVADTVTDQVHPTAGGATKMADKWFSMLQTLLE